MENERQTDTSISSLLTLVSIGPGDIEEILKALGAKRGEIDKLSEHELTRMRDRIGELLGFLGSQIPAAKRRDELMLLQGMADRLVGGQFLRFRSDERVTEAELVVRSIPVTVTMVDEQVLESARLDEEHLAEIVGAALLDRFKVAMVNEVSESGELRIHLPSVTRSLALDTIQDLLTDAELKQALMVSFADASGGATLEIIDAHNELVGKENIALIPTTAVIRWKKR